MSKKTSEESAKRPATTASVQLLGPQGVHDARARRDLDLGRVRALEQLARQLGERLAAVGVPRVHRRELARRDRGARTP